ERYHHLFLLGRLALIPISCAGAWLVFEWARELYGAVAALVPCALYVLCPNMLAHGSIVGTDTCTTVAMLAAVWGWWRYCKDPRWMWWGIAVTAASAAILSKQTAIMLPGAMLLMTWFVVPRERARWKQLVGPAGAGLIVVLILLNLGHLFQGTGRRLDSFHFSSHSMKRMAGAMPAMRLPVPGPMLEG